MTGLAKVFMSQGLDGLTCFCVPIMHRSLLADPDVAGHAIMALGKLGTQKAANVIKPFLKHKTPWLRVEAEKALSLIDTHAKSATDR
jgi:HEAT repeat protein